MMTAFKTHLASWIAVFIGVSGAVLALYAWGLPPFHSPVETTDNAYVRGKVAMLSPRISGYVTAVLVQDFQRVKAGQELARIDPDIYRRRLEQAQSNAAVQQAALDGWKQKMATAEARVRAAAAQIASGQAGLKAAQARWDRVSALVQRGVASQKERDDARAALDQSAAAVRQGEAALDVARQDEETTRISRQSLEAAVAGAEAAVQLARLDLDSTRIVAPADGRVGEVGARVGQYVTAGTQLMGLAPDHVWVVANFKETQVRHMLAGQPASFTVDALGGLRFQGRIDSFSPATASEFSVLKTDNATGNFTKIVQRVPVRILINPDQPQLERLTSGLSVVASVDTTRTNGAGARVAETGR